MRITATRRCGQSSRCAQPAQVARRMAVTSAAVFLALSGPAFADSTTVPGVVSTSSTPGIPGAARTPDPTGASGGQTTGVTLTQQTTPLAVPVPPGTVPSAITGVLTSTAVADGATTTILVNGREGARVPSLLYTQIVVPVTTADVTADGTIALALRFDPAPGATGCPQAPGLTLRGLGLELTGAETPPASVSTFFAPATSRVDVRVSPDAGDDLLQAALNAVSAIGSRYPAEVPVELSFDDQPLVSAGAGQRVVQIVAGGAEVTTTLGSVTTTVPDAAGALPAVPSLTLSGSGLLLSTAAGGLGGDALAGVGGAEATGVARPPRREAAGSTRTLDELRSDAPQRTPDQLGTVSWEVRQDSFGRVVPAYAVHLTGSYTAVPEGSEARLDLYADDELVGSQLLDSQAVVDLDATVPGSLLRTATRLRATIVSTTGPDQTCAPGLPLELSLDGGASTVTALPDGRGPLGLQQLPQAFDGRLDVALLGTGTDRLDGAIDAARLLAALQRAAVTPLEVTLVDPDVLLAGGTGLVVGADTTASRALDLPLSLSADRSLPRVEAASALRSDQPLAALQSVVRPDGPLLVLGSWQPGDTRADPSLSHRLTQRIADDGWGSLSGDILAADRSGTPYALDSGSTATPSRSASQPQPRWSAPLVGGVLVALALLVLLLRLLREPRRSAEE